MMIAADTTLGCDNGDTSPPPLEDMSVFVASRNKLAMLADDSGKIPALPKSAKNPPTRRKTVDTESLLTHTERQQRRDELAVASGGGAPMFGFKKGFLTAPCMTAKNKVVAPAREIEAVRPTQAPGESLRFQQVQDAIKSSLSPVHEEIMTSDFVSRVVNNPLLAKAAESPDFQDALHMFAKEPKRALEVYSHRPEIMEPLREYSGLLGDHLSKFNKASSIAVDDLPQHEQELVKRFMSDPEAQSALRDPKFAAIFADIVKNPKTASRCEDALILVNSAFKFLTSSKNTRIMPVASF